MMIGSSAAVAIATKRARGRSPWAFAYSGDATSTAPAPSTMPEELPAWWTCWIAESCVYRDKAR